MINCPLNPLTYYVGVNEAIGWYVYTRKVHAALEIRKYFRPNLKWSCDELP